MLAVDKIILGAVALSSVLLAGCDQRYVRRDEFNAAIGNLRGEDTRLQAQADEFREEDSRLRAQSEQLRVAFEDRISDHDVRLTELRQGRVRIDMAMHFDYKQTALREEDKRALDDFAAVARERSPNVLVTVEGFTDSAGSPAYNRRLGQARAERVKEHLIAAGMRPGQVRAVSYGEDRRRQIAPGASAEQAQLNRRVTLVVEYAPKAAAGELGSARPARQGTETASAAR